MLDIYSPDDLMTVAELIKRLIETYLRQIKIVLINWGAFSRIASIFKHLDYLRRERSGCSCELCFYWKNPHCPDSATSHDHLK